MSKSITKFIHELGHLKRIKHEGWRLAGVQFPESVAEHSLRAAQIAYILGHMEGHENPERLATMLVFHDMGECRIGDLHKVASRYVDDREREAVLEQTQELGSMGEAILKLWDEAEERKTDAGWLAKEADYLEQAFTAKEYMEQGITIAEDWLNNVEKTVKTESAKSLVQQLRQSHSTDWWKGLKHFKHGFERPEA